MIYFQEMASFGLQKGNDEAIPENLKVIIYLGKKVT
jgi:hypothetical protein